MENSAMSNTVKEDITYLRGLAEQGRSTPILGGVFLAAAGVIFGAACFIQWAMMLRGADAVAPILELWGGAMLLFALVWTMAFLHMRRKGVLAVGVSNTTFHMSWFGCGIGITVSCIGVGVAGAVVHSPLVMLAYPPMVFAFYGSAWLVTGALARRRWMYGVSAAAYSFAVIVALLSAQAWLLPAMGVALVVTLAIPGFLLMRETAL
jgi:hypothetical protein